MSSPIVPRRRRVYTNGQLLLISIIVLFVLIGSGLLVYSTLTAPGSSFNNGGTATAQANASRVAFAQTGTAYSSEQGTAQAQQTSTAHADLTATAQANAYATATANALATANANATAAAQATIIAAARATSIAEANATATAQAISNPYPPYTGTLALDDPLYNNGQGHGWDIYSLPVNGNCRFTGGAYESTIQNEGGSNWDIANDCNAEKTSFTNFTFQVDMTILKGECGGLNFRRDSKTGNSYQFIICVKASIVNQASNWALRSVYGGVYFGDNASGFSGAIHTAYGQTNVLAVTANGSMLTFYVNGQKVGSKNWSTGSGQIGLISSGAPGVFEDVLFRNAKVWTI